MRNNNRQSFNSRGPADGGATVVDVSGVTPRTAADTPATCQQVTTLTSTQCFIERRRTFTKDLSAPGLS
jgi:hypothetical protein